MEPSVPGIADKRRAFRQMHEAGCFVIPNPWDVGSARLLQSLGFKALASTSSGLAWSCGQADSSLPRDRVLAHLAELVAATDVPINADFESGYATDPAGVALSVRLAVDTGVAGLSIEDATGRPAQPLHTLDHAVERLRAARRAIDAAGGDVLLVARAECFLVGRPDLDETCARLRAYAGAGADCLYAPGLRTPQQIAAVVAAVAPKPVNVLMGWAGELTVADLAALGVRRISVGGALARTAWGAFQRAARQLATEGRFDGFAQAAAGSELDAFFTADHAARAALAGLRCGARHETTSAMRAPTRNPDLLSPFHLAFPVRDLAEARTFYGGLLGCPEGRSSDEWVDFNFYGHQIVAHLAPDAAGTAQHNAVDGHGVPVRHFGIVLPMTDWQALAQRLRDAGVAFVIEPYIRFKGEPGEQATMFFLDPSGNAIEIKAFTDIGRLFAT